MDWLIRSTGAMNSGWVPPAAERARRQKEDGHANLNRGGHLFAMDVVPNQHRGH